jgi:CRP/FNR family transcriptional regulator, dissimilatory nitrate respiration regulator
MLRHPIRIIEFLRSLPLFEALEDCALARLAAGITAVDVTKGTVLLRRGDPCIGFHVVVFGQIKVSLQTPKGDEKVVDLMGRGQSFGESAMFLNRPYLVTAEALTDSKVLHLPRATVMTEIDRNAMFAHSIIIGLSQRLNHLIGHIEGYTLRSGTQRVIGYLLSELPELMQAGKPTLTLPAQKGVIASQLNLTQEHFSRILHDLAAGGLIEVRGRVVHIHDMTKLRSHA